MIRFKDIRTVADETLLIANQWAAQAEAMGTSVSASAWAYNGSGTLSGADVDADKTSVSLAATGSGWLENAVIFADGECIVGKRWVQVG